MKDILSVMGINPRFYMYCVLCALARLLPEDARKNSYDGHFET